MPLWMVVLLSMLTIGTAYALTPSRVHLWMLGVTATYAPTTQIAISQSGSE